MVKEKLKETLKILTVPYKLGERDHYHEIFNYTSEISDSIFDK